jgi:hypothetical protein
MWDLWWTKWHWDRFFFPSTLVFSCQFNSTGVQLQGKMKKKSSSSQGYTVSLKAAVRP